MVMARPDGGAWRARAREGPRGRFGRRRGSRLRGRDGVGHQSEIERRRRSSEGLLAAEGERWDRGSLGLVRQRPAGPWATGGTGLLEAQMARLARLLSSLLILLFTKTEKNKRKKRREEKRKKDCEREEEAQRKPNATNTLKEGENITSIVVKKQPTSNITNVNRRHEKPTGAGRRRWQTKHQHRESLKKPSQYEKRTV